MSISFVASASKQRILDLLSPFCLNLICLTLETLLSGLLLAILGPDVVMEREVTVDRALWALHHHEVALVQTAMSNVNLDFATLRVLAHPLLLDALQFLVRHVLAKQGLHRGLITIIRNINFFLQFLLIFH